MHNKRAAIELSIGTMVIIVLAMAMLILGLVLVQNIFSGAKYNVQQINDKVKDEINKLFEDNNQKIALYLPGIEIEVGQGETFGLAFGVKNTEKGTNAASSFSYQLKADSIGQGCNLPLTSADRYIDIGSQGEFELSPGQTEHVLVNLLIPENAPLCSIRYRAEVKLEGQPYASDSFVLKIT